MARGKKLCHGSRLVQAELFPERARYNNTKRRQLLSERRRSGRKRQPTYYARERLSGREPVLVTPRLEEGLPSLRAKAPYRVIRRVIAEWGSRFGFRVCQVTAQTNHLHLIVEAESKEALSRGQKGLSIRIAKALNRLWKRKGAVFDGRFHARVLRTPREVWNALRYTLQNVHKHRRARAAPAGPDPYSSGVWFTGWRDWTPRLHELPTNPCARARTWLLRIGWRKHWGLLSIHDRPAPS